MMYTKLFPLFAVLVTAELALATECMDTWGPKRCEKMTGKGFCVPVNECPSSKTFRCSKTRKFCAASCGLCDEASTSLVCEDVGYTTSSGSAGDCAAWSGYDCSTYAYTYGDTYIEDLIAACPIACGLHIYFTAENSTTDDSELVDDDSEDLNAACNATIASMQDTNDELQTTNAELQDTNGELNATIASMQATIDELQGTINSGPDLSGVDLSCGAVLGQDGAVFAPSNNLAGLNLDGAQLTNAIFASVNLVGASLKGIMGGSGATDFSFADLSGADLTGAILTGANFDQADLTGAILVNADLGCWQSHMANCAYLYEAIFVGANLTGANFVGADVTGADFTGAIGANLTGAVGV